MIRQDIKYAAEDYAYRNYTNDSIDVGIESFIAGAEWANKFHKSSWISVKDDLPYKHPELILCEKYTERVIVKIKSGYAFDFMVFKDKKWNWDLYEVEYWAPIPR